MRSNSGHAVAVAFLPLVSLLPLAAGCKARSFNAGVKSDTVASVNPVPSGFTPASSAKALPRDACVTYLREKIRAGVVKAPAQRNSTALTDAPAGFNAEQDMGQFLYCRDLLTAPLQGHDELKCVTAKTNTFLEDALSQVWLNKNSQGFHLSDVDYSLANDDRVSLGANLPAFLDVTQSDEQKRAQAQDLLARLFNSEKTEAAYAEAVRLVAENNSDTSKPRLWLTRYQVERTLSARSWRILILKEDEDKKCTYLSSFTPPKEYMGDKVMPRDIATHAVCDASSIDRVDGKSENGVWMFNWIPDKAKMSQQGGAISYHIQIAPEGRCYRCHTSKSKLIQPDVASDYKLDETSKAAMDYLRTGDNRLRKKADWVTAINVDGVKRYVAHVTPTEARMPTSFSVRDASGAAVRPQPENSTFKGCLTRFPLNAEKAGKDRASCRNCHTDDPKSLAGTWVRGEGAANGTAAVWPLVLQKTHPFHKYHQDFSGELFECLKAEDRSPERKQEWKEHVDMSCAKLAGNPDFDWLVSIPVK